MLVNYSYTIDGCGEHKKLFVFWINKNYDIRRKVWSVGLVTWSNSPEEQWVTYIVQESSNGISRVNYLIDIRKPNDYIDLEQKIDKKWKFITVGADERRTHIKIFLNKKLIDDVILLIFEY